MLAAAEQDDLGDKSSSHLPILQKIFGRDSGADVRQLAAMTVLRAGFVDDDPMLVARVCALSRLLPAPG